MLVTLQGLKGLKWQIKNHFQINSFALSIALEQRLGATRKWPIQIDTIKQRHFRGTQLQFPSKFIENTF